MLPSSTWITNRNFGTWKVKSEMIVLVNQEVILSLALVTGGGRGGRVHSQLKLLTRRPRTLQTHRVYVNDINCLGAGGKDVCCPVQLGLRIEILERGK